MDNSATAIAAASTPEYFQTTYGVDAAQAQQLASQALLVGSHRGAGMAAEPQGIALPALSVPSPGAQPQISAQAEYSQLMADRASGKINDSQWSAFGRGREAELADQIIA